MGLHNALTHPGQYDHGPETVRRLAAGAGLALTDDQVADLADRAFGKAYRFQRCYLDRATGELWPDDGGTWYLRCHDEDGGGGVPLVAGQY